MFDKYVGSTIQLFAKINLALYVIAGFIFLIWAAVTGAILGVILTIAVPLSGLFFSYLIYGFGVLVENSQILVENVETHDKKTLLRKENGADDADRVKSNIQRNADNARRKKIEDLRKSGLITEEEYRNAISKIQ